MWVDHSPMRVTLGWARCADNVADILRRGAWYPIVEESSDGQVVVEVRQQDGLGVRHGVRHSDPPGSRIRRGLR